MKKLLFLLSISLILSGCHIPSQVAMEGVGGRNAYNIEVQKTNAEEMLLNLVRLKYYDSPFFLEVSNVTTSFTYKNFLGAALPIPGINQLNPFRLGGETSWQNQPTIQYSPLEGQEFANQLMQPLELSTIQMAIYSGWDIDRVFKLVVQSFKELYNAPRGTGPVPMDTPQYKEFYEVIGLLRQLQLKSMLQVGLKEENDNNGAIDGGKNNDNKKQILQLAFSSHCEEGKAIAKILDLPEPKNGKYIVSVQAGFDEKGQVGILPRSILSCMYYLSQSVEVPCKDAKLHKASGSSTSEEEILEWNSVIENLMRIYSSSNKPKDDAYVSIKYRDSWFYIKDNDLSSKRTFMLLLEFYNLQSGRRGNNSRGPILTLPIGI